MALENLENQESTSEQSNPVEDLNLKDKFNSLRKKVKESVDPYLEKKISDEEYEEDDLTELDDLEEKLEELEDLELKEEPNKAKSSTSKDFDEWDKWVFNNKISPPARAGGRLSYLDDDYLKRFDPKRSPHLWKSDPDVPENMAFGSLHERNNNILATNLRKYQNETLTTGA